MVTGEYPQAPNGGAETVAVQAVNPAYCAAQHRDLATRTWTLLTGGAMVVAVVTAVWVLMGWVLDQHDKVQAVVNDSVSQDIREIKDSLREHFVGIGDAKAANHLTTPKTGAKP